MKTGTQSPPCLTVPQKACINIDSTIFSSIICLYIFILGIVISAEDAYKVPGFLKLLWCLVKDFYDINSNLSDCSTYLKRHLCVTKGKKNAWKVSLSNCKNLSLPSSPASIEMKLKWWNSFFSKFFCCVIGPQPHPFCT